MLYREIIAFLYSDKQIHKYKLCGQDVEFLIVKVVLHIVTSGLDRVKSQLYKRVS
jgi:hypothetical protein